MGQKLSSNNKPSKWWNEKKISNLETEFRYSKAKEDGARVEAQQVKVRSPRPTYLSLILRTHNRGIF